MKGVQIMNLLKIVPVILLMTACGDTRYNNPHNNKNVLVIGDSISGGWFLPTQYLLRDEFRLIRLTANPSTTWIENARNTNYTLRNLDGWLTQFPNNDTIVWNNGIWNAAPVTPGQDYRDYGTDVAQYEAELIQIATKMKVSARRVIFLTTTQLTPSETRASNTINFQFNDIAKRVLPPLGVEVHDLWEFTIDHQDWHTSPTDLHFHGIANENIAYWLLPIIRKL